MAWAMWWMTMLTAWAVCVALDLPVTPQTLIRMTGGSGEEGVAAWQQTVHVAVSDPVVTAVQWGRCLFQIPWTQPVLDLQACPVGTFDLCQPGQNWAWSWMDALQDGEYLWRWRVHDWFCDLQKVENGTAWQLTSPSDTYRWPYVTQVTVAWWNDHVRFDLPAVGLTYSVAFAGHGLPALDSVCGIGPGRVWLAEPEVWRPLAALPLDCPITGVFVSGNISDGAQPETVWTIHDSALASMQIPLWQVALCEVATASEPLVSIHYHLGSIVLLPMNTAGSYTRNQTQFIWTS